LSVVFYISFGIFLARFEIKNGWNFQKTHLNDYFTYLCGTPTNTWLRPAEKDLSMSDCLGEGYRCSPHPPTWISVCLDFSFHWVWL
jgi:hypothetical protein